jgi:hypothetical protein
MVSKQPDTDQTVPQRTLREHAAEHLIRSRAARTRSVIAGRVCAPATREPAEVLELPVRPTYRIIALDGLVHQLAGRDADRQA